MACSRSALLSPFHPIAKTTLFNALPDPHTFLGAHKQLSMYTACWLMMWPLWINLATHRQCGRPYPHPQDWKIFLVDLYVEMGLVFLILSLPLVLTLHKKSSGSQKHNNRQKHQKTGHEKKDDEEKNAEEVPVQVDKFSVNTSGLSPTNVFWQGKLLITKQALIDNNYSVVSSVYTEVIWELFNGNFMLELLTTDWAIVPCSDTDLYSALGCDALVATCFPDSIYVSLNYPMANKGLGAFHWQDRIEYVEAFCFLLSLWGRKTVDRLRAMSPVVATLSKADVLQVEQLAYHFYCRTFFDNFGCAPCIPCQLPLSPPSS